MPLTSRLGLLIFSVICLLIFLALRTHAAPQPVGIAVDAGSQTWLLWNNPDGSAALTKINPDGALAGAQPQPYGPITGWNCGAVATGPSTPHLLWQHPADGQASVWTLDASGTFASSTPGYGSSSSYAVQGLSVDGDSQIRLLLKSGANAQFSVWQRCGP